MSGPSRGPVIFLLVSLCLLLVAALVQCQEKSVTYDGRSIMINGKRDLFFSGSIHYPRFPPEMWPDILKKAKSGGINLIQTYVFWNLHEPIQGKFNFSGSIDVVKYIRTIGELGLYVTLRVGPFIEAEWNFGGFPYWLKEIPDIAFRTDNAPFKQHMQKFAKMIIDMMKAEKLFAPQGGPIILAQIENEYNNVQLAYKEPGAQYIQWSAKMAVALNAGVPWMMCKQKDAPDPVINTCNGRNCGDTFTGPNKPHKPILWTENWTAQYRVYGDPPSQRAAEDIAFSVARFFSKNGTLANYYMYYGGTNFGRTTSSFVLTRYYDEAPIDEFGLTRDPKYGHLRDLHAALRLCQKALFNGQTTVEMLGNGLEASVFEKPGSNICAAFLTNNNTKLPASVNFRGKRYFLPRHSISILPDCKTVVFNTQMMVAQHSSRNYIKSEKAHKNLQWEMSPEVIPTIDTSPLKASSTIEHWNVTKDTSDYLWYTTSIDVDDEDLPIRKNMLPALQVASLGHLMHVFVNGIYIGSGHGTYIEKSFVFQKPVPLKVGINHIQILSGTVGLPDNGAYMEHRFTGVHAITIKGLNTGTIDLSYNTWGHKTGVDGETNRIFTEKGTNKVKWTKINGIGDLSPLTWYRAYFDSPEGKDPIALEMGSMSKGMMWINGQCIGRYWVSFKTPLGKPSQATYHMPRAYLKPTGNLLVILEEIGGHIDGVKILTVNRDTICSYITELHPPNVNTWKKKDSTLQTVVPGEPQAHANIVCPEDKKIVKVDFASFGTPLGYCGSFELGNCTSPNSLKIVEQQCLGRNKCAVPFDKKTFGGDPCPLTSKVLAIQVECGASKK